MAVRHGQGGGSGHGHPVAQGALGEALGVDATEAHPQREATGRFVEAPLAQATGERGGEHLVTAPQLEGSAAPEAGCAGEQALGQQLAEGRGTEVAGGLDPGEP